MCQKCEKLKTTIQHVMAITILIILITITQLVMNLGHPHYHLDIVETQ